MSTLVPLFGIPFNIILYFSNNLAYLPNVQDEFIKKTNHLQGFLFILSNLAGQSCLSLVQVLFLQIIILIERMLLLLILLLI